MVSCQWQSIYCRDEWGPHRLKRQAKRHSPGKPTERSRHATHNCPVVTSYLDPLIDQGSRREVAEQDNFGTGC
jgi:hypothetical protein